MRWCVVRTMGMGLLVALAVSTPAAGQTADARLAAIRAAIVPGEVAENITAAADPSQRYAVYLPSGYSQSRAWPVMFLMDPRGRAMVPMGLFMEAAERRGWVLVSSYNTSSDGPDDTNSPAVRAMLSDASQLFELDARRAYFAGFSGTARAAWLFARALGDTAAGVIGYGGGLPTGEPAESFLGFAFYGAAGFTDFNYREMQQLDDALDVTGFAHRFEYFPGGHSWGTPEVAARAVDWMELHAMRTGRRDHDAELVATILAARTDEAAAWESKGPLDPAAVIDRRGPAVYEAWLRYRAIEEDFADLVEPASLANVRARRDSLDASAEVLTARAREQELQREESRARQRFFAVRGRLNAGEPWDLDAIARELGAERLRAAPADAFDPAAALSAQRVIADMLVQASFYLPREEARRGRRIRAGEWLDLAEVLRPGDPGVARMRESLGLEPESDQDT